jgi:CRISPR type I-A-associated protein Csa5
MQEDKRYAPKVMNLVITASLLESSPTLIDRLANALSKEVVVRVISDCQRILSSAINRGQVKQETDHKPSIIVTTDEGTFNLYGYLPDEGDVMSFLNDVENDVYVARKTAALAITEVNRQLLGIPREEARVQPTFGEAK